MRARMARRRGVDPRHEALDLGGWRYWPRQVRNRRQRRSEHGLSFHRADAAQSHRCRNKSRRRRVAGDRDRGRFAHATGAPDKALYDRQMTVSFAVLDQRSQLLCAGGC